jgi:hypothetical protein
MMNEFACMTCRYIFLISLVVCLMNIDRRGLCDGRIYANIIDDSRESYLLHTTMFHWMYFDKVQEGYH